MNGLRYYQIDIQGQLPPAWEDWFGGLRLETRPEDRKPERAGEPECSRLSGWLPDQSALLGVLDTLHNLGLTVINLNFLEETPAERQIKGDLK